MKIYEKPMAIINKFEVEDVIAASVEAKVAAGDDLTTIKNAVQGVEVTDGVVFEW